MIDQSVFFAILSLINRLRDGEGSSVTINCSNPDGPPNESIEVTDDWTGWEPYRFEGDTLEAALKAAIDARTAASDPYTKKQKRFKRDHGTPEEFASAVLRCHELSNGEAENAVRLYVRDWIEAGRAKL